MILLVLYAIGATAFAIYGLLVLLWPEKAYKVAWAWMILVRVQRPDIDWEPYIRRMVPPRPAGLFLFLAGILALRPALLWLFRIVLTTR
jgi:hypothetical protein